MSNSIRYTIKTLKKAIFHIANLNKQCTFSYNDCKTNETKSAPCPFQNPRSAHACTCVTLPNISLQLFRENPLSLFLLCEEPRAVGHYTSKTQFVFGMLINNFDNP